MHPALAWVAPFAIFLGFLTIRSSLAALGRWEHVLWVAVMAAVIWFFSRRVLSFRCVNPLGSVALGLAVFALWVGPDVLIPGYRNHWLFQNQYLGTLKNAIATDLLDDPLVLVFRTIRATIIVAIVEELFWRGWLMRWLIKPEFDQVPLGAYDTRAFWITAALFASEHGPYWDVGLACGAIYNWWMLRTKSIGDLIVTHGVTNLALSLYTIATKQWHYWL